MYTEKYPALSGLFAGSTREADSLSGDSSSRRCREKEVEPRRRLFRKRLNARTWQSGGKSFTHVVTTYERVALLHQLGQHLKVVDREWCTQLFPVLGASIRSPTCISMSSLRWRAEAIGHETRWKKRNWSIMYLVCL